MSRSMVVSMLVFISMLIFRGSTPAQLVGSVHDVVDIIGSSGKINWTTSVITAAGIGAPPSQPANAAQARAIAERTAQVVALRNMLEAVKAVRVDSATTVENSIVTSDIVKTQVNDVIQRSTMMDKKYLSDGSVEVTVGMKITGALAEALLPKTAPLPAGLTAPVRPVPSRVLYTGLIVDARGLGLRPAMAPRILNEQGKEIYGSSFVNRDWAVREGMTGYLKGDPADARSNPRVTDKPLVVKAIKVSGDNRVDAVISNADAAALQSASKNLSILEKCRVLILVD